VLVRQLPPESALSAEQRVAFNKLSEGVRNELEAEAEAAKDYEAEQWSRVEQLIAAVRDELHFLRHDYEKAHSKGSLKWKAHPLPRPGVAPPKKKRKATRAELDILWMHLQSNPGDEPT